MLIGRLMWVYHQQISNWCKPVLTYWLTALCRQWLTRTDCWSCTAFCRDIFFCVTVKCQSWVVESAVQDVVGWTSATPAASNSARRRRRRRHLPSLRRRRCVVFIVKVKKVKFSHTRYRALGPELIPVYRQSARRWSEVNHAIYLAVVCHCFLPGLRLPS